MASAECIRNARLTCENPADYDEGFFWRYAYTIDDANYQLTSGGFGGIPAVYGNSSSATHHDLSAWRNL